SAISLLGSNPNIGFTSGGVHIYQMPNKCKIMRTLTIDKGGSSDTSCFCFPATTHKSSLSLERLRTPQQYTSCSSCRLFVRLLLSRVSKHQYSHPHFFQ